MKKEYFWFCSIERFGYMLQCVGRTEDEVRNAIIKEYIEAYKKRNDGIDPKAEYELYLEHKNDEDFDEYSYEDAQYYEVFLEELYIEKREFGKVEWD